MGTLSKGDLVAREKKGMDRDNYSEPEEWIDVERGLGLVLRIHKTEYEVEVAEVYWQKGIGVRRETRMRGIDELRHNPLKVCTWGEGRSRKRKEQVPLYLLWKVVGRSGSECHLVPSGGNGELAEKSRISLNFSNAPS